MPQPFNYSLNIPDPTQGVLGAIQLAQGVDQLKSSRAAREAAATAQAQFKSDLASLGPNATPAALSQLMVKYPQMSEDFNRVYNTLSTEQQSTRIGEASRVYAALEAGETDIAQQLLSEHAEARRNSGLENEAKAFDDYARLVELNPETAKTSIGLMLASAMGPDQFTETFTKLETDRRARQLEASDLTAAEAKAFKAAVDADFAESQAALDLQKKGWDITKIQNDIQVAKENQKIAVAKNQLQREQNALKRDKLATDIAEMKRKRDEAVQVKVADAESARGNIDNMLNNVDRILQLPAGTINDSVGAWDGSWIGGLIDTFDEDVQNFKALMENLEAQAFLAQVPQMKGLGALSENEGKKLGAALQSFNTKQSEDQFITNLKETQRLMMKARENLATRYGIPDTVPDTPAVETSAEDIQALLQKYGGGQ